MTGAIDMGGHEITGVKVPGNDTDAATKKYVDDRIANLDIPEPDLTDYLPLAGGTMTGDIDAGGNTVTGVKPPVNGTDVVTKEFFDRYTLAEASFIGDSEVLYQGSVDDFNGVTIREDGYVWLSYYAGSGSDIPNTYVVVNNATSNEMIQISGHSISNDGYGLLVGCVVKKGDNLINIDSKNVTNLTISFRPFRNRVLVEDTRVEQFVSVDEYKAVALTKEQPLTFEDACICVCEPYRRDNAITVTAFIQCNGRNIGVAFESGGNGSPHIMSTCTVLCNKGMTLSLYEHSTCESVTMHLYPLNVNLIAKQGEYLPLLGGTLLGNINMGGNVFTNTFLHHVHLVPSNFRYSETLKIYYADVELSVPEGSNLSIDFSPATFSLENNVAKYEAFKSICSVRRNGNYVRFFSIKEITEPFTCYVYTR